MTCQRREVAVGKGTIFPEGESGQGRSFDGRRLQSGMRVASISAGCENELKKTSEIYPLGNLQWSCC